MGAVARIAMRVLTATGRDKPVPYGPLFLDRAQPIPRWNRLGLPWRAA